MYTLIKDDQLREKVTRVVNKIGIIIFSLLIILFLLPKFTEIQIVPRLLFMPLGVFFMFFLGLGAQFVDEFPKKKSSYSESEIKYEKQMRPFALIILCGGALVYIWFASAEQLFRQISYAITSAEYVTVKAQVVSSEGGGITQFIMSSASLQLADGDILQKVDFPIQDKILRKRETYLFTVTPERDMILRADYP